MNSCMITLQVLAVQALDNRTSARCCFSYTDARTTHTLEQELTLTAFGRSSEILARCGEYDIIQVIGELWFDREWELVAKNCPGAVIPADGDCPVNHISIVGNHGSDKYKELKYFETGTSLCKFGMAVNRKRDSEPTWFRVRAWGKTAEVAANYTRPGDHMGVEGTIGLEAWEGKQQIIIVANRLELMEPKSASEQAA